MATTHHRQFIRASAATVYRHLLDPGSLPKWKVPDGMTMEIHEFDATVNGRLRISLSYEDPSLEGKSARHTDTYSGLFKELVKNRRIVEVDRFETSDSSMAGEMTITIELNEVDGGTELTATHEGLPAGVAPADNEAGWAMSLAKLARLCESS